MIQSQTRLVNQLTARLSAYYPIALQVWSSLQQRSTLVFLQTYPTLQQALKASGEQIAQVLKQAGHPTAKIVAPKMVEALHQPQVQAARITTRTTSRLMLALIAQLVPLVEQIAAYDKVIADLCLTHADRTPFASLPGAGKRLAPRRFSEWGDDRKRSSAAASLQALAGTSPAPYESGNSSKVQQRYACVKPKLFAMQQFAWQSTAPEPWARASSQRKRKEGKSHSMAVRALANVWVRRIFARWQKQEPSEREIFAKAKRLHEALAA